MSGNRMAPRGDDYYNEIEAASENDFNNLAFLLLSAPRAEYARRMADLRVTGEKLLYRDFHHAHAGEFIDPALEYFVSTYLPGPDGGAPRKRIRHPGQAYRLLHQAARGRRLNLLERDGRRRGLMARFFPAWRDRDRHSLLDEYVAREDSRRLRRIVSRALNTRAGVLGHGGVVFSAETKKEACRSYLRVLGGEVGRSQWIERELPTFLSEGVDANGRAVARAPMDWFAFIGYWQKKKDRVQAHVLRALSPENREGIRKALERVGRRSP